jgi:hypothetical protein
MIETIIIRFVLYQPNHPQLRPARILSTRAWLGHLSHFAFHYTPTAASRLNPVEGFFAALARHRRKRGVFRSIVDQAAINRLLKEPNLDPKPLVLTADLDKSSPPSGAATKIMVPQQEDCADRNDRKATARKESPITTEQ